MNRQAEELSRRARLAGASRARTMSVSIVGGKGGVGTTVVATCLAAELARLGKRVLLIDADARGPNAHLLAGPAPLDGRPAGIRPTGAGFDLVAALSEDGTPEVGALAAALPAYDVVLADAGAGRPAAASPIARGCTRSLVVTTPDPAAVAGARSVVRILADGRSGGLGVVVTRVATLGEARRVAVSVGRLAGPDVAAHIPLIGCVFEDSAVSEGVRHLSLLSRGGASGGASRCVRSMARKLLSYPLPDVDGQGLCNRLLEAM